MSDDLNTYAEISTCTQCGDEFNVGYKMDDDGFCCSQCIVDYLLKEGVVEEW